MQQTSDVLTLNSELIGQELDQQDSNRKHAADLSTFSDKVPIRRQNRWTRTRHVRGN